MNTILDIADKLSSHVKTIAHRAAHNARQNIPALAKNPAMVFTETDSAWFQHSVSELHRGVTFQIAMRRHNAAQKEAANKARNEASKEYLRLTKKPTCAMLLKELSKGPERFQLEAQACNMLAKYVDDFSKLEFMRMTQKGQTAYYNVADLLKELSTQSQAAYDEYSEWKEQLLVSDMSQPALEADYVNCKVFNASYDSKRESWVVDQLGAAAKVCANAIEFETVKAYVVSLEGTDDDEDRLLNEVKEHVGTASSGATVASGFTPGQPGTILAAVGAFVDAGTSVVDKFATSAIRERRVEKIIKSTEGMQLVVKSMNANSTMMAEYLHKKFIANLEFGLSQVRPMITGGALGLDAAGLGAPVGNIGLLAWNVATKAIITAANRSHKRKVKEAVAKKLRAAQGQEAIQAEAVSAWENAADALKKELPDFKKVFNEATNAAAFTRSWKQLSPPGQDYLVEKVVTVCIDPLLKKMKIPPADLWTGDDFVKHITRLDTFSEDMRRMGYGVRETS